MFDSFVCYYKVSKPVCATKIYVDNILHILNYVPNNIVFPFFKRKTQNVECWQGGSKMEWLARGLR